MTTVWRCTKADHVLEIDGEFQPNCRPEAKYEGSTCCHDKLYIEKVYFLHCLACELDNQCMICNDEQGSVIYEESF